jgi:hypothetical protein
VYTKFFTVVNRPFQTAKTSGLATKEIISFMANPLVYLIFWWANIKYTSGLAAKEIISFVTNPLVLAV